MGGDSDSILVSVIIPVYNVESYVYKCLFSLKSQKFEDFEVVIIDDGSTDGTGKICDDFAKCNKGFKVIHKENSGVSDARNVGIRCAKGRYIVFVDGDDYVAVDYLQKLYGCIECNGSDLGCADYYIVNGSLEEVHSKNTNEVMQLTALEAINALADKNAFQGYVSNKIFKKSIIVENNIFFNNGIKIWEDMLFCLEYMSCIESVGYLQFPIYYYVQREDSAMNNPAIWKENTHLKALELMWKILQPMEGEFKEYIRNFYANNLVGLLGKKGYDRREDIKENICKAESLKGRLRFKHKVKKVLYKYIPTVMCKIR